MQHEHVSTVSEHETSFTLFIQSDARLSGETHHVCNERQAKLEVPPDRFKQACVVQSAGFYHVHAPVVKMAAKKHTCT